MSLISDALKTAQRARSDQAASAPGANSLLEGFFPYVSSSSPKTRPNRTRIALVSALSLIVLASAGWFGVPAIRRYVAGRGTKVPIVVPPREVAVAAVTPPAQSVEAPDEKTRTALLPDSLTIDPTELRHLRREDPPALRTVRRSAAGETRAVVTAAETAAVRRDSETAKPSPPSSTPDRRGVVSGPSRPSLEAEAVAAFNAGDYQTARTRFEAAVRVAPSASAWTNYGVTLEKVGDPRGAAQAYQTATGIDPNYFNAWLYLARVYNLFGDVGRAVPFFNRALEIEPNNTDVNADLAELEYKAGAFGDARRYADVAARNGPANARAHYYLALSADTLKDRSVARQAFEDYLRTMAGQEKENPASIGYARVRLEELRRKP